MRLPRVGNIVVKFAKGVVIEIAVVFAMAVAFTVGRAVVTLDGTVMGVMVRRVGIAVAFATAVTLAKEVILATIGITGIVVAFTTAVMLAKEVILATMGIIGVEVAFAMAVMFAKVAVIFAMIGRLVTVVPFNTAVILATTGKSVTVAFATDVMLATVGRATEVALAMVVFVKAVALASVSLTCRFSRRPGK